MILTSSPHCISRHFCLAFSLSAVSSGFKKLRKNMTNRKKNLRGTLAVRSFMFSSSFEKSEQSLCSERRNQRGFKNPSAAGGNSRRGSVHMCWGEEPPTSCSLQVMRRWFITGSFTELDVLNFLQHPWAWQDLVICHLH